MADRLDKLLERLETIGGPHGVVTVFVRWKDQKCFPERLVVRANTHAILWVTDGDSIAVDPIAGLDVRTLANYSMSPPAEAARPETKYTGMLHKAGEPARKFDPRLEVIR